MTGWRCHVCCPPKSRYQANGLTNLISSPWGATGVAAPSTLGLCTTLSSCGELEHAWMPPLAAHTLPLSAV